MIKSIAIENFQSHEESELELSPGINLITGESDNGKSAILRGLIWAIENRPLGDDFIRNTSADNIAAVEIETEDYLVARSKGKAANLYYLDDEEMEGFGNNPPDDIKQALKISEINIQKQKDSFYLFDKSAGEVGRYLNSIIDLTVIDTSLTHANKRVKDEERNKAELEKLRDQFGLELLGLNWIDDIDKELQAAEQLERENIKKTNEANQLFSLLKLITKAEKEKTEVEKLACLKDDLQSIDSLFQTINKSKQESDQLDELIHSIITCESEILESKEITNLQSELDLLIQLDNDLLEKGSICDELENLINAIEDQENIISELSDNLMILEDEFHELMPDQCPLCGEIR